MRSPRQLEFEIRTHGGRRAGAGRPRAGRRRNVAHRRRATHARHAPAHVTLRAGGLPASLRMPVVFAAVRTAIGKASREVFGVIAFSVQRDHVHLLVESDATETLSRGVQGLAIRIAKAVNRTLGRRARGLGGSIPCARPEDTARGAACARRRAEQSPQARRRSRLASRPLRFGAVVPGLGVDDRALRHRARRHSADLVGAVGLEASRPPALRRDSWRRLSAPRPARRVPHGVATQTSPTRISAREPLTFSALAPGTSRAVTRSSQTPFFVVRSVSWTLRTPEGEAVPVWRQR